MNWGLPTNQGGLGYANQPGENPTASSPWSGTSLLGVGVNIVGSFNSMGDASTVYRADSANWVWNANTSSWELAGFAVPGQNTVGFGFNAPSASDHSGGCTNPNSPSYPCAPSSDNLGSNIGLGDHLVATAGQTIEITFGKGVAGVGLLISGASSAFDANITAYSDTSFDTPLQTYGMVDTSGGTCSTVTNDPPTPCNNAPFMAVSVNPDGSLIRAIKITIPNGQMAGFAIDQLEFETVPEPAVDLTMGGGLALMAFLLRRRRFKPNAAK